MVDFDFDCASRGYVGVYYVDWLRCEAHSTGNNQLRASLFHSFSDPRSDSLRFRHPSGQRMPIP